MSLFKSSKNEDVFGKINIDDPDSYIVALDIRSAENPKHYYLSSAKKFNQVRKKWRFNRTNSIGRCGYDYNIIVEPTRMYEPLWLCFDCNTLVIHDQLYEISEHKIRTLFSEDFNPVRTVKKSFDSIEDARAYWATEEEAMVLYPNKIPKWVKYDGKFKVEIKFDDPIPETFENNKSRIKFFNKLFFVQFQELGYTDGFSASYYSAAGDGEHYIFNMESPKLFWEKLAGVKKENWREYSSFEVDLMFKK